jgi:hypothetical protein
MAYEAKIAKERTRFVLGSVLILSSGWGLAYYVSSTVVLDPLYPETYDIYYSMLSFLETISRVLFLLLLSRFSIILKQKFWVTIILGLLVFGLSIIPLIAMLIASSNRVRYLKKHPEQTFEVDNRVESLLTYAFVIAVVCTLLLLGYIFLPL